MNKLIERESLFVFIKQLFRFGIVGLTAAAVHFSVVVLLVQQDIVLPLLANIFGFIISFQVSYWGHRSWTFAARVQHQRAMSKLLIVQLSNLMLNETLFYLLLSLGIPYAIALIFVLATCPVITFLPSKFWVFRKQE